MNDKQMEVFSRDLAQLKSRRSSGMFWFGVSMFLSSCLMVLNAYQINTMFAVGCLLLIISSLGLISTSVLLWAVASKLEKIKYENVFEDPDDPLMVIFRAPADKPKRKEREDD